MKEYIDKMYKGTKQDFIAYLQTRLLNNEKTFVVTANPEILMMGENDSNFDKLLLDSNTQIVADGIGILKGAKLFGIDLHERIPGVELCETLLKYCSDYEKTVYLFGASKLVLDKLVQILNEKYHNLKIVGHVDGFVEDKQNVFNDIKETCPDLVLVALGAPLQEKLIYNNLSKFSKGIFIGVGGSFDVLSGLKKRAPKIFIKLNLEWLYRIAFSPKRWKRFYNGNIKYLFKIRKEAKKLND